MDPCANLGCVLRVNASCEHCTRKVLQVLSFICDSRSVSIDVQAGVAHIRQRVDVNMVLHALAKSGQYAELVKIRVPNYPDRRHVGFANPLLAPRIGFDHHHQHHGRHGIAHRHHSISKIVRHHHHHHHHHHHCC